MDTKGNGICPNWDDFDKLHNDERIVGAKQIKKALDKGIVRFVILAKNADPAITGPLEAKCKAQQICCTWAPTMDALGKKCGIDVGTAAAAAVH